MEAGGENGRKGEEWQLSDVESCSSDYFVFGIKKWGSRLFESIRQGDIRSINADELEAWARLRRVEDHLRVVRRVRHTFVANFRDIVTSHAANLFN